MNQKKEWKIVLRDGGKSETLETFVSDKIDAIEKMIGKFLDLEVDTELTFEPSTLKIFNPAGEILWAKGDIRIGTSNRYLEIVSTGVFEIESNVPVEVIVEEEEKTNLFPISIPHDDVIINPINYRFRNKLDLKNLTSEDLKELLGNAETLTFWGTTILSRLNKVEAEIFSDVLRDFADILSVIDKKNPK